MGAPGPLNAASPRSGSRPKAEWAGHSPSPALRFLLMNSGPIVIKIGGAVAGEGAATVDEVAALARSDERLVLVHGGGPLVGEWSQRFGLATRFEGGLRVTDPATRDIALAVLAGLVNKRLVAALRARGVTAVGISGADGDLLAVRRAAPSLGLVGEVVGVRPRVLQVLLEAGLVPLVAPAAIDPHGELVNVNADAVAGALAAALSARLLVFVTDVEGLRDASGAVVRSLDRELAARLIHEGVVSGGMLPKVDACLAAAAAGCVAAIVPARDRAAIARLSVGGEAGTVVRPVAAHG